MHAHESIAAHLRMLEESLLEPSVRKTERVSELLAEGFVEFGSSGRVFNKAQILAALRAESGVKVTASHFQVQLLAPQTALVTYRACRHAETPVHTLRSSVWQQLRGQWQMVFHQGTVTASSQ